MHERCLNTFGRDARWFQIFALAALLSYGVVQLHFDIAWDSIVIVLGTVLFCQYLCTKLFHLPFFDPKSALISGLSLCLLFRSNSVLLLVTAGVVAVASKFVFRWRGKHLFNPTNFAIVVLLSVAPSRVWVSPGQWGMIAFFAFLMVCLGGLVVSRAARADVAISFLVGYLALLFGRSFGLGEPMSIPFHRMQSGALLLFAFFMISDPKTTPNSRAGRIVFALFVAVGAWYIQFRLFRTNGLLWSLAASSLVVPVLDWLLPGPRYQWQPTVPCPVNPIPSTATLNTYETIPA